jgi:hypothetical protein
VFILTQMNTTEANVVPLEKPTETKVQEEKEDELDLTMLDVDIDPTKEINYDVEVIAEVSVPGEVNPVEAVGIFNSPEQIAQNIPPPPGTNFGTGLAMEMPTAGHASMIGDLGGMGGIHAPGGIAGRSGATRQRLLNESGGNEESEACVARGLRWMALHQASDGNWSLHEFHRNARTEPLPGGRTFVCNCDPGTTRRNDIAATGFGLLPFLGAGITHRPSRANKIDYSKSVMKGLDFLITKQGKDGYFGEGMYSHGLCTIAMCEAYGMTSDPTLKVSAQRAIDYIVRAQDPAGGGWRYSPRSPGDTSVTGWQVMALKSGQMCGLNVPKEALQKVEYYLDAVENSDSGYGYMPQSGSTPTMTAVGLLCRQYLGVSPRNLKLLKGVEIIKKSPPGRTQNMYYEYYATQVMHHMGGKSWNYWNLGPDGTGKGGFRDLLIANQYIDKTGAKGHQTGSWDPLGRGHANDGGRIMSTSLSVLMLEVFYRHLPLYRRDLGVTKPAE